MTVADVLTEWLEPGRNYVVTDWEDTRRTLTFVECNDLSSVWRDPRSGNMVLYPFDAIQQVTQISDPSKKAPPFWDGLTTN